MKLSTIFAVSFAATLLADSAVLAADEKKEAKGPKFVSMFDGKTLKGWEPYPKNTAPDWSVKDGMILGLGLENRLSYLIFEDKQLGDFELEFSYKMFTKGNTGVEIRARVDKTGKRPFEGYHADLGHVGIGGKILGAWDFHFAKRKEHPCFRGMRIVIDENQKAKTEKIPGAVTPKDIKKHDWNKVRVVATGRNLKMFINGKLASEFTDHYEKDKFERGLIGLQLHDKGMKVGFKDLRLKRLGPSKKKK